MPRFLLVFAAVLGLSLLAPRPAAAYYDDVHYVLTYYIARQSGYTPLQAHRVASACSMVDWDPDTEPVQPLGQGLLVFTPLDGKAQNPRAKFHAMRDDRVWDQALGTSKNGAEAQGGVLGRARRDRDADDVAGLAGGLLRLEDVQQVDTGRLCDLGASRTEQDGAVLVGRRQYRHGDHVDSRDGVRQLRAERELGWGDLGREGVCRRRHEIRW